MNQLSRGLHEVLEVDKNGLKPWTENTVGCRQRALLVWVLPPDNDNDDDNDEESDDDDESDNDNDDDDDEEANGDHDDFDV